MEPGFQSDGSYLTPEGQRLRPGFEQAAYLRTVQDWIIGPQLRTVAGVAGVDVIGGFEKQYHIQPDPAKLIGFGLSFRDLAEAIERNATSSSFGSEVAVQITMGTACASMMRRVASKPSSRGM